MSMVTPPCTVFMFVARWNIRELNHPLKQLEVSKLVRMKKISLLAVLETKIPEEEYAIVLEGMLPRWQGLANYSCSDKGRILVAWNPQVLSFTPLRITDQPVHGRVIFGEEKKDFFVSFVYGELCFTKRRLLWDDIEGMGSSFSDSPWHVLGDFNAIKDISDRQGGTRKWLPCFDELRICMENAG